jgi:ATP-dependent exoDNAse (exonuclease V) alpha subunit
MMFEMMGRMMSRNVSGYRGEVVFQHHPPLSSSFIILPTSSFRLSSSKTIFTTQIKDALQQMETGAPFVFVTGRAGTGKSTLLREFRKTTSRKCVFVAPTGVAALNIQGETIHSLMGLPPNVTPAMASRDGRLSRDKKLFHAIDTLVVDELSMVRADLLDSMDAFLRSAREKREPFGGVRIVGIGDLYQLPPVVTTEERGDFLKAYPSPFFFGSRAFGKRQKRAEVSFIELTRIFRQRDPKFIKTLNAIREQTATSADFALLNTRLCERPHPGAIVLTATNMAADAINSSKLRALRGKSVTYQGTAKGRFGEKNRPTAASLTFKKGARVMFVANDPMDQYVNGTVGTVEDLEPKAVVVTTDDGKTVHATAHTWNMRQSAYHPEDDAIEGEIIGSFTQIPLRLAWAVTIHKSQGKTFDRVHIDLGAGAFASGQTYVALSRARTLEGITLARPISRHHVLLDASVRAFMQIMRATPMMQNQRLEIG